jgi:hypothetical protein
MIVLCLRYDYDDCGSLNHCLDLRTLIIFSCLCKLNTSFELCQQTKLEGFAVIMLFTHWKCTFIHELLAFYSMLLASTFFFSKTGSGSAFSFSI